MRRPPTTFTERPDYPAAPSCLVVAAKRSPANQALGRTLRSARARRGYSQETFAARAGLDRANYGAIERGEFNVTLDTIVKLAAGLQISASELFGRAGL
jgi:DNA-binding XRE family transcriptional regulator